MTPSPPFDYNTGTWAEAPAPDVFELVRRRAVEDAEFRATLAELVSSAQLEAEGPSPSGADHGLVVAAIDRVVSERDSLRSAGITALQVTLDHGHRLVLIVTTVLAFVVPAAVYAKVMHPGWLRWSVFWLGSALVVGVARLHAAQYSHGFTQAEANRYYRQLFGLFSAAFTDARALNAVAAADAAHLTRFERMANWIGYSSLALDLAFYALFVAGVGCACGGMVTALQRLDAFGIP